MRVGIAGRIALSASLLGPTLAAAATPRSAAEMTARIDQLLEAGWKKAGVTPAPPATDAEFLRRAYLDLTGRIPRVGETREFLADTSADKRARLINSLLEKPNHATHLANTWRRFLLPDGADLRRFGGSFAFENWLRQQFADNRPYDAMVRELLTAEGRAQSGPVLFYTSLQLKPEELAASTSRAFLGVQIQCAQCHDHPFDAWSQKDFWSFAAFFAQLERPAGRTAFASQVKDTTTGEVTLPDSKKVVPPRFLKGETPLADSDQTRRQQLAAWLTAAENPYFARAAVNRVWGQLFGRGLVDPVDDLGEHNKPSHPQLLNELAEYFAANNFDLRNLTRVLAATRAYQLSSRVAEGTEAPPPTLFARMKIKPLTAEQLYDCLETATARRSGGGAQSGYRGINRRYDPARTEFLAKFRIPAEATDYQAGIPQALSLMCGKVTADATDLEKSDLLVALQAPFFSDNQRIETLFLATLAREPSAKERQRFTEYVNSRSDPEDRRRALSDILWALLNSAEFALNH